MRLEESLFDEWLKGMLDKWAIPLHAGLTGRNRERLIYLGLLGRCRVWVGWRRGNMFSSRWRTLESGRSALRITGEPKLLWHPGSLTLLQPSSSIWNSFNALTEQLRLDACGPTVSGKMFLARCLSLYSWEEDFDSPHKGWNFQVFFCWSSCFGYTCSSPYSQALQRFFRLSTAWLWAPTDFWIDPVWIEVIAWHYDWYFALCYPFWTARTSLPYINPWSFNKISRLLADEPLKYRQVRCHPQPSDMPFVHAWRLFPWLWLGSDQQMVLVFPKFSMNVEVQWLDFHLRLQL